MMIEYMTKEGLIDSKAVTFLATDDKGKVDFLIAVPPNSVESLELIKKMVRIWLNYVKQEQSANFWKSFGAIPNRDFGLPRLPNGARA